MKHKAIHETRFFFSTTPLPCPYLPDRVERRVVTELVGREAARLHDQLSIAGFRRSHGIAYAPACPECNACTAVRVRAREFKKSRSHRRILNVNRDVRAEEVPVVATGEQYQLFTAYQESRHPGGEMSKMDFHDYQALIEDTPVDTFVVEFRTRDDKLVAVSLIDRVESGLSAVYSFFDPVLGRRSLGSFMILWMIRNARLADLDYVYLGFWIRGCSKMSYKERFQPLEARTPEGWKLFPSSQE